MVLWGSQPAHNCCLSVHCQLGSRPELRVFTRPRGLRPETILCFLSLQHYQVGGTVRCRCHPDLHHDLEYRKFSVSLTREDMESGHKGWMDGS